MNVNDCFSSRYLSAKDLDGKPPVNVTISRFEFANVEGEKKPVIHFVETETSLILNKTNAGTISDLYGPETDAWTGMKILVLHSMTEYQGRSVGAVRVARPDRPENHPAPREAPPVIHNGDEPTF